MFYEANKYTIHAEIDCLKKINIKNKKFLKKCKLFIVKINNTGIINSAPCHNCENIIKKYNIGKIYYSN